ncbi:MAG: hypothetical protein MJZ19_08580 [Paludibacteraceae bacterium]|nr:hypothetical protein [Paludibacteraceae bacterium]
MRKMIISILVLFCLPRLSEAVPQVQDLDYSDALEEIENILFPLLPLIVHVAKVV